MPKVPTALTRVVLLTVLVLGAAPAPAASAAPPPSEPTPTQCLQAFSADTDYVGEGWPGALVTTASNGAGEFSLFCGDELSGVVHTAHPDSTGTGHPIDEDEDEEDWFTRCFEITIEYGTPSPDGNGRTRYVWEHRNGTVATVIVDDARRFAYTVFATGHQRAAANDWLGCAMQLA